MSGKCHGSLQWVLNSGACYHMSSNVHGFNNLFKLPYGINIKGLQRPARVGSGATAVDVQLKHAQGSMCFT